MTLCNDCDTDVYTCISLTSQLSQRQPRTMMMMMMMCSETERVYECDLVLLAMGFLGPEKSIIEQLTLSEDTRGNINTPNVKYVTNVARVYSAGGTHNSLFLWSSLSVCLKCLSVCLVCSRRLAWLGILLASYKVTHRVYHVSQKKLHPFIFAITLLNQALF